MLFKDVRVGQTIYILNRQDISMVEAKAINVSLPHLDTNIATVNKMVVDITLDLGSGTQATYTVTDGTDIAYTQDKVLSVTKENLTPEVESICTESQRVVDSIEDHKSKVAKCQTLLSDLKPEVKEKRELDNRLTNLESSMSELKNLITNLSKQRI